MPRVFSVYILECSDKSFYIGCTNNIDKRLREHNHRKNGARYTRIRRPVKLVYKEEFETLIEARGREALLKTWPRTKKYALITANT